jgi:hypothetical protein
METTFLPDPDIVPLLPATGLPDDYPTVDFYGNPIVPGTSVVGAVVISDVKLATLQVSANGTPLDFTPATVTFNPDVKQYTVTVANSVTGVVIAATAAAGNVIAFPADTGTKANLADGNTIFKIRVTAAVGGTDTTVYTVNVYRQSNNADLATLTVVVAGTPATLSPDFDAATINYTVNVGDATSVTISATPVISGLNVIGVGIVSISGDTTLKVVVTSETSVEKTYTIHVTQGATGVETLHATSLQAYPNPTSGVVYIDNPDGAEAEVYAIDGTLVLRSKAAVIDLSKYAAGVYIIKVGGKVAKVVKH